eukprot:6282445-Prymnesium_polylepis.1
MNSVSTSASLTRTNPETSTRMKKTGSSLYATPVDRNSKTSPWRYWVSTWNDWLPSTPLGNEK